MDWVNVSSFAQRFSVASAERPLSGLVAIEQPKVGRQQSALTRPSAIGGLLGSGCPNPIITPTLIPGRPNLSPDRSQPHAHVSNGATNDIVCASGGAGHGHMDYMAGVTHHQLGMFPPRVDVCIQALMQFAHLGQCQSLVL